jgi:uncharacterized protein (DUF1778 family)
VTRTNHGKARQRKTLDVPVQSWNAWKMAAQVSNVSILTFIVTVCDHAAKQVIAEWERENKIVERNGERLLDI